MIQFNPSTQCHWCGNKTLSNVVGYGGEKQCKTCGFGGDGEPDVPCMYYKLIRVETHR